MCISDWSSDVCSSDLKSLNEFVISSKTIHEMLGLKQPDFRMRDNELALRFVAFKLFLENYNGNLKLILDETTKILNSGWKNCSNLVDDLFKEMEFSIKSTKDIFGRSEERRDGNESVSPSRSRWLPYH